VLQTCSGGNSPSDLGIQIGKIERLGRINAGYRVGLLELDKRWRGPPGQLSVGLRSIPPRQCSSPNGQDHERAVVDLRANRP
jgi:hypothetical protein